MIYSIYVLLGYFLNSFPESYFNQEIGHISGAQTCQRFCNELYNGTCQWFMYDKTTEDCKLFSSSLNDLWNDCREVGYAREPNHELCDEMFPSDSSNGCYVSTPTVQLRVSIFFSGLYLLIRLLLSFVSFH